jgi:hypothetical protein
MTEIKQNIVLNFLPLNEQEFSFTVFRRKVKHQEKKWDNNVKSYKLPQNQDDTDNYVSYWVSFNEFENSEPFTVKASTNIYLSEWYIHFLLHQKLSAQQSVTLLC